MVVYISPNNSHGSFLLFGSLGRMFEAVLSKTIPIVVFFIGALVALGVSLILERYKK